MFLFGIMKAEAEIIEEGEGYGSQNLYPEFYGYTFISGLGAGENQRSLTEVSWLD